MPKHKARIGHLGLRSLRYAVQQLQITREALRQAGAKTSAQAVTHALRTVKDAHRRAERKLDLQDWKND